MENFNSIDNLYDLILEKARKHPLKTALQNETGSHKILYREFIEKVEGHRVYLEKFQLSGRKVLVLSRPDTNLLIQLCAYLAEGASLVFVDPRLGKRKINQALKDIQVEYLHLEPKLFFLRLLWPAILTKVNTYKRQKLNSTSLKKSQKFALQDLSFIALTSGSTGNPKIVPVPFECFAQRQHLAHIHLPPLEHDVHHCGYLLSAMQNLSEGATTILSEGKKNRSAIIAPQEATRVSGPPGEIADWVMDSCNRKATHPNIKSVMLGGAPIPNWLLTRIHEACPNAMVHVIYGSTEAEPMSKAERKEILSHSSLPGYFVGEALPELDLKISPLNVDTFGLMEGKIGELWVSGKNVIKSYLNSPEDERFTKHTDEWGQIWHYTGDLVYLSEDRHITLLGRSKDIIKINNQHIPNLFLESMIENMEGVRRVCILSQNNELNCYIEPFQTASPSQLADFISETLKKWISAPMNIHFRRKLSVDPRHRWKLQRNKIS